MTAAAAGAPTGRIDAAPGSADRTAPGPATPAIYEVVIGHSRSAPLVNRFRYRSYMWLVDYDDLAGGRPLLPGPLGRLARLDPADHLDIRAEAAAAGVAATRIVTLTNARVAGYVFNPISIHWCYGPGGDLAGYVAEVHNTYGGRHAYVIRAQSRPGEEVEVPKQMYVSPFYPVDGAYRMRVSEPGDRVAVSVVLDRPGDKPFRAAMTGRRRPDTLRTAVVALLRWPFAPLRARALIQWQGMRLWFRGLEVKPR